MLRTAFIGSHNPFNEMIVHWLGRHTDLRGVVWIRATQWQRSWRGRLTFARTRWRRYGLRKTIDETLFYLYNRALLQADDEADLYRRVVVPYRRTHGSIEWSGPSMFTQDVNSEPVLDFLESHELDVAFAMCINSYFKAPLRAVAREGLLLWHEGITPEYRGLYSPFWAVHNLDFDRIGYTLLRTDARLDGGEVFVQGRATGVDPYRHRHGYLGHKAIADSLPEVARFLDDLEHGRARPIADREAEDGYYTYPGITDYIRQQWRLRRARREGANAGGQA